MQSSQSTSAAALSRSSSGRTAATASGYIETESTTSAKSRFAPLPRTPCILALTTAWSRARGAAFAPSAAQAKLAAGMPRKQLIGFGTAFGKFTKSKQFRLHVTCLDFVAQHAQHDSTFNRRASQHCPSWPPAPPQGAPGGSGRLDSPSGRAQPLGAQPLPRVLGATRRLQWRRPTAAARLAVQA